MSLNFISEPGGGTSLPFLERHENAIFVGDALTVLRTFRSHSFQCCVTAPPYWGSGNTSDDRSLGGEASLDDYVEDLREVFHEVFRVLTDEGTLWLNMGDTYTVERLNPLSMIGKRGDQEAEPHYRIPEGVKPYELVGVPWRVAFALRSDGWFLRSDIIWSKPNCLGELVPDRPTRSHEYVFLFSKTPHYQYNREAIMQPSVVASRKAQRRSVWTIPREPVPGYGVDTVPLELIELCLLAGTKEDDYALDPFFGSGTLGLACEKLHRHFAGVELEPSFATLAGKRLGWEV